MADEPLVVETGTQAPDSCVIWLHGLGADGHDFEPIVPELRLDPGLNVRFIFPHAPMMPVTINQGFVMRAWYDISELDIGRVPDEEGIRDSIERVEKLIEQQMALGIESSRIVLAGFSQGGVIALHCGLCHAQPLAGILALSTYVALQAELVAEKSSANEKLPIFLAHGSADPVIPVSMAHQARSLLEQQGLEVRWNEYPGMAHSVSQQEILHIAEWIEDTLG